MCDLLQMTSGDFAGASLVKAGLPGEIFVWHDILYDGPRRPGWPDESVLKDRAVFLENATGGGLGRELVLATLRRQYHRLADAAAHTHIVLWFDACLFDQSMLAHILACLLHQGVRDVDLLCVDAFPGVVPYHGLGQLNPEQLASLYGRRRPVTAQQFDYAVLVDQAFATQDLARLKTLSESTAAPLPWIPAAVTRWLLEQPDPLTGLGRLESLALAAIRAGAKTPGEIFASVAAAESPPQYWGDTTLWAKINALADRVPPLVKITGPADRLPQWEAKVPLREFRVTGLAGGDAARK